MRPISPHARFFSSLKQVEQRLASERDPISAGATPSSPISSSSPLYLCSPKPHSISPLDDSSGPLPEFLSIPPPTECDEGEDKALDKEEDEDGDDIERLIGLLGLSADGGGSVGSCHCSGGGFYRRAVGLEGPICAREMERLEGWIGLYRRVRREPARLAHLLLGKVVAIAASGRGDDDEGNDDDDDDGFWGIGFPPTVVEFLENDPPLEKGEY